LAANATVPPFAGRVTVAAKVEVRVVAVVTFREPLPAVSAMLPPLVAARVPPVVVVRLPAVVVTVPPAEVTLPAPVTVIWSLPGVPLGKVTVPVPPRANWLLLPEFKSTIWMAGPVESNVAPPTGFRPLAPRPSVTSVVPVR